MNELKGKIFWVLDDFSYVGLWEPKTGETYHTVARLENIIIEDYMIRFTVLPHDIGGEDSSYRVNLNINESGKRFDGTFYEASDPDNLGKVYCEMFKNDNKVMLYGQWEEDQQVFTWWARIE